MKNTENLYRLKDKLIENLCDYADAQINSAAVVDVIQKASSAVKNICKIIEACEDEESYSNRGGSYRGSSYDDGGVEYGRSMSSYARGRRNAPRDAMGRYSGDGYSRDGYSRHSGSEAAEEIRALIYSAPDEQTKQEMERLADMLERR